MPAAFIASRSPSLLPSDRKTFLSRSELITLPLSPEEESRVSDLRVSLPLNKVSEVVHPAPIIIDTHTIVWVCSGSAPPTCANWVQIKLALFLNIRSLMGLCCFKFMQVKLLNFNNMNFNSLFCQLPRQPALPYLTFLRNREEKSSFFLFLSLLPSPNGKWWWIKPLECIGLGEGFRWIMDHMREAGMKGWGISRRVLILACLSGKLSYSWYSASA